MSQTIVVQEQDVTLRVDAVIIPARDPLITSTIKLPVGGAPLTFVDENDGLLLTLDANGNIISEKGFFELTGQAEPAASPAGKMRLYFDSATNKLLLSENGGAYVGLGNDGDVVGPASATDTAVALFDGVTGKLIKNSLVTIDGTGTIRIPSGEALEFAGTTETISRTAGELLFTAATTRTSNTLHVGVTLGFGINIVPGGNAAVEWNNSGDFIQHQSANLLVRGGSGGVRLDIDANNGLQVSRANLPTSDETIFDFNAIVNKATSGDYIGIKLNVTETLAPGTDNRLIDVGVGGTSQFKVSNSGDVFTNGEIQFAGTSETISRGASNFAITSTSGRSVELNATGANVVLNSAANSAILVQTGGNPAWQWNNVTSAFEFTNVDIVFRRTDTTLKDVFVADRLTGDITIGDAVEGLIEIHGGAFARLELSNSIGSTLFFGGTEFFRITSVSAITRIGGVDAIIASSTRVLIDSVVALEIDGDLNHDGTNVGFYGTAPAAQSAAYIRNAAIVEDRTLLASASATTLNNNNVLAALIADLQSRGFIG